MSSSDPPTTSGVPRPLRLLFVAVLLVSLGVGIWLYLVPEHVGRLWPYAMKPLATRFFASVFLAVALGSLFALRERAEAHVRVLLVLGVSVFGLILLAALPTLRLDGLGVLLWLAIFVAIPLGSAAFLWSGRGATSVAAAEPVPAGLRYSLLAHTVVVVVFATPMLLVPDLSRQFWPWIVTLPIMRGIGGLFLGVVVGTAWAFRQRAVSRLRVLLPVNVTFVSFVLLAVAFQWNVVTTESPGLAVTVGWLLLYFFTGGYALLYLLRLGVESPR